MELSKVEHDRKIFANRLVLSTALLVVSIATNLVLGLSLMNNQKTILVPTLPTEASIDAGGQVDRAYLEGLVRDDIILFLDKTPETAGFFMKQAERVVDPSTFEQMRLQLEKDAAKEQEDHSSQSFIPDDFYLDPANLYAEVRGHLVITSGKNVLEDEEQIYDLKFSKNGNLVRLLSLGEIDPKDAKGEKVKPVPAAGTEGM